MTDDDGHTFVRGQRAAVCRKTSEIYYREPYAEYFVGTSFGIRFFRSLLTRHPPKVEQKTARFTNSNWERDRPYRAF